MKLNLVDAKTNQIVSEYFKPFMRSVTKFDDVDFNSNKKLNYSMIRIAIPSGSLFLKVNWDSRRITEVTQCL